MTRLVLMSADSVGGVWTYALELARALAPLGTRVALTTMGAPLTDAQRADALALPTVEIFESTYRLEWMGDPWEDVARAGEWLRTLERRLRPDVVHLNGYAHASAGFGAPVVVVAHSCVCSWWRAVKGERAPDSWNHYRTVVARDLGAAGAVVAPTRAMLDALRAEYGLPFGGACVIANGRDAAHFASAGEKEPFVLAAGRLWDEAKNVAALGAVADRLPWPVYVAGDARHPDVGAAAISSALRPLGVLGADELSAWMGRAAIFALPARYEPFGLSALEAALSGCALVLGDLPSLREVWDDAAVYVRPDDHDALVAAIAELASDDERRREMSDRAAHRAARYTPRRMAAAYAGVYDALVAGGPPPSVGPALSFHAPAVSE